jgi:hypothetical protein
MSARNELADTIEGALDRSNGIIAWAGPAQEEIAAAILAAGYRKPRIITTPRELEALPVGSVIWAFDFQAGDSNSWQLFDDVNELTDEDGDLAKTAWLSSAYKDEHSSDRILLRTNGHPITVIYSPEES